MQDIQRMKKRSITGTGKAAAGAGAALSIPAAVGMITGMRER
jgi:hypothetical protein